MVKETPCPHCKQPVYGDVAFCPSCDGPVTATCRNCREKVPLANFSYLGNLFTGTCPACGGMTDAYGKSEGFLRFLNRLVNAGESSGKAMQQAGQNWMKNITIPVLLVILVIILAAVCVAAAN